MPKTLMDIQHDSTMVMGLIDAIAVLHNEGAMNGMTATVVVAQERAKQLANDIDDLEMSERAG